MRIATWNVARPRPRGWKIAPGLRTICQRADADIWILTETHAELSPAPLYASTHSAHDPLTHTAGEYWTMIWSRYPIVQQIAVSTPQLAVCCEIHTPVGPSIVYGTVLPDGTAKSWEPHYDVIRAQAQDWKQLRADYPDHLLCVAGDLNQNRGGPHEYGTIVGRDLLTDALQNADLICATEGDLVAAGLLAKFQTIDHICVSHPWQHASLNAWEGTQNQVRLSDHNGVSIEVTPLA